MSEPATRKDIDEVIDIMRDFMQQTSSEFDAIRQETKSEFVAIRQQMGDDFELNREYVNNGFSEMKQQLVSQNDKYDHLIQTIGGFISRIDHYETEQKMRDYQFEKLLAWARKVSEKMGIPLENL
jgi:hypothetical protein